MQEALLDKVDVVFMEEDNKKMYAAHTLDEIKKVLVKSNHLSAPGTDSIPNLLYYGCFESLGPVLMEVIKEIHTGRYPMASQGTSLMIFADKPKKIGSKFIKDKRTLSLLNTDFKITTGLEASQHKSHIQA